MSETLSYALLGLIQGVTEFLPVSSSGHLVLVRDFLGETANGLAGDAVLQLATALAIIVYFWKDILNLIYTGLYMVTGRPTRPQDVQLLVAIIAGTIPAVILGLFLEDIMETAFRSPQLVAYALLAGSVVMVAAEFVGKRLKKNESVESISWRKGVLVGLFQSLALIPGMSRSGMTISGGLFLGLSREAAARFGFLLAVPIILGSGLKKLWELYHSGSLDSLGTPLLVGSAVAFFSGLLAIYILLKFVRTQPLYAFVAYRILLAGVILISV